MWMLYAYDDEGGMIIFNKSVINSILKEKKALKIMEGRTKSNEEKTIMTIKPEQYELELIDIVYVGQDENGLNLKKSIYGCNRNISDFSYDLEKDYLNYYSKLYGWSYENEVRLVLTITDPLIKLDKHDNCFYYIYIKLNHNKVIAHPNLKSEKLEFDGYKAEKSNYSGKISWSLKNITK